MGDRSKWKEKLQERQKVNYSNKDDSGRFKSILKPLPDKYSIWKCSADEHLIDIIAYEASSHNPNGVAKGDPTYNLDVFVHRKVGPNEDNYICLARTFKKNCPICEHSSMLKKTDDYDEAEVKALNPTRRCLYNIWVHDNNQEEGKGVQIWEVSHFLFEKELDSASRIPKGGGFLPFSDDVDGLNISFIREGKGATNSKFTSFHFLPRETPLTKEIIDKVICLDDLIYVPTYEEVYEAFHSSVKEIEEEEKYEGDASHMESIREEKDIPDLSKKDEEDPREARRRAREERKSKDSNPCPHGHEFGKDIDKFDECSDCKSVDDCEAKADEYAQAIELLAKEEKIKEELKKEETKRPISRRPGK